MKFRDRTVMVTGAGRGIGRSIALHLAEEGARAALVARTRRELDETARLVREAGAPCASYPIDVTEPEAAREGVAAAEAETEARTW